MSFMVVVLRATGLTATVLSFAAALCMGQPKVSATTQQEPEIGVSIGYEYKPLPIKKTSRLKRVARAVAGLPKAVEPPPTPVGVQVVMSNGAVHTYPLGAWLLFQEGKLRAIMPTQYVDQPCTVQPDGTWTYTRPGRNVQVWRNGLLQRKGPDYTLNQAGMTITPVKYPIGTAGELIGWGPDDYVTVAYLY